MVAVVRDLWHNILSGARLLLLQRSALASLRSSADQLVLLLSVGVLLGALSSWFDSLPLPVFDPYAVTAEGFGIAALLLGAFLVARWFLGMDQWLRLAVALASLMPALVLLWWLLDRLFGSMLDDPSYSWFTAGISLWGLLAVLMVVRQLSGGERRRMLASYLVLLSAWVVPQFQFGGHDGFWYPGDLAGEDPLQPYREMDAEGLMYDQPELLESSLFRLQPGRPGVTDVYFVGVAGFARQDVFAKEVRFARQLFDSRFDTGGRSLLLINNLTTREEIPLATATNLGIALRYLGGIMDPEEDILVLYLTSHGSEDSRLAVDFWPLPLRDIGPEMLRDALADAGIKWRVIMVSACYSGGFVSPLADSTSAIATAAAADRTSFGCADRNDFTYFGEALLKQELQTGNSLRQAFAGAVERIRQRERDERLEPSDPQVVIGSDMAARLEQLTTELAQRGPAGQTSL